MTAYATTLEYNANNTSNPTWNPNFFPIDMQIGDTLTINFSNFLPEAYLAAVTVTSTAPVLDAISLPPSTLSNNFSITANPATLPFDITNPAFTVTITDNLNPAAETPYWLAVSGVWHWQGGFPEVFNNPGVAIAQVNALPT